MSALRSRRTVRHLALPATVALALLAPVTAAATAATTATTGTTATAQADCATAWGSLVKRQAPRVTEEVTDVRSGRHRCFDRLVVDLGAGGSRPGFRVEYVDVVRADGSGAEIPLRGAAQLRVVVTAPAYDEEGRPTYRPADRREVVDVAGYDTFRQVALAGTFEGTTTVGLGVRSRLPMRAFTLADADGGHRVVVDVAHAW